MTITTMQVQGSDGERHEVPLLQGDDYDTPIYSLPDGAATSAKQDIGNTLLNSLDTKATADPATSAKQDAATALLTSIASYLDTEVASILAKLAGGLPAALGAGGGLKIDGSGTVLPVAQQTADAADTARTTATLVIPVQLVDSVGRTPKIDSTTKSLMVIDYAHHEIHSGSHFFVVGYQDLAINQVLDFTWTMPAGTKWTHWVWDLSTQSQTNWLIYEGAVATNPLANVVTPLNSDRNSLTASGTTMRYEVQANLAAANGDTDVTTATLIKSGISGSGKGGQGVAGRDSELILKAGTTYCLRAIATAAGYINFDMQWYEHTNS